MPSWSETRNLLLNSALALLATFGSLFLCEALLRLLEYPRTPPLRIAHGANVEEVRQSVEFRYLFRTNSQGLRYRETSGEKDSSTFKVFVVGDSFAEGWGVEESERFTALLERSYRRPDRRVHFINGGIAGTGPVGYLEVFLQIGLEHQPDALLICLFANDVVNTPISLPVGGPGSRRPAWRVFDALWPRTSSLVEEFLARQSASSRTRTTDFVATVSRQARRLGLPRERIDAWEAAVPEELVQAVERGEFVGSILSAGLLNPTYWIDSIDISSARAEEKWENLTKVLLEIVDRSHNAGVVPAMVFIPSRFQYDPDSHKPENPWIVSGARTRRRWLSEDSEIQRRLRTWCRGVGVPLLDLTPTLRDAIRRGQVINWQLDGHWNRAGHRVAAEAIHEWLSEQEVFPPAARVRVPNG